MRISVSVKAGSKTDKIIRKSENNFLVFVKKRTKEGKANEAVINAIAEHFGVSKSRVSIIKGLKSHRKIIEITQFCYN